MNHNDICDTYQSIILILKSSQYLSDRILRSILLIAARCNVTLRCFGIQKLEGKLLPGKFLSVENFLLFTIGSMNLIVKKLFSCVSFCL